MKTTLTLILALFATLAQAETITLGPVACSLTKQCLNIPNDAALDIDLYGSPGYPFFYIYVDGVQFKAEQASNGGFDNVLLTAADGSTVVASGSFSVYSSCVRSGRGQHCSTHWQFTGGQIIR